MIFKIESYFKAIELTTGIVKRDFLSSLISFLSLLRSRPVKKTIGFSFVRLMQEEKWVAKTPLPSIEVLEKKGDPRAGVL